MSFVSEIEYRVHVYLPLYSGRRTTEENGFAPEGDELVLYIEYVVRRAITETPVSRPLIYRIEFYVTVRLTELEINGLTKRCRKLLPRLLYYSRTVLRHVDKRRKYFI